MRNHERPVLIWGGGRKRFPEFSSNYMYHKLEWSPSPSLFSGFLRYFDYMEFFHFPLITQTWILPSAFWPPANAPLPQYHPHFLYYTLEFLNPLFISALEQVPWNRTKGARTGWGFYKDRLEGWAPCKIVKAGQHSCIWASSGNCNQNWVKNDQDRGNYDCYSKLSLPRSDQGCMYSVLGTLSWEWGTLKEFLYKYSEILMVYKLTEWRRIILYFWLSPQAS